MMRDADDAAFDRSNIFPFPASLNYLAEPKLNNNCYLLLLIVALFHSHTNTTYRGAISYHYIINTSRLVTEHPSNKWSARIVPSIITFGRKKVIK